MTRAHTLPEIHHATAYDLSVIPVLPLQKFQDIIIGSCDSGLRLVAYFAARQEDAGVRLYAVLADDARGVLLPAAADVGEMFPAITAKCTQAHLFEREIFEQTGVLPDGHPWLKPVRFTGVDYPARGKAPKTPVAQIGITNFFRMEGEEVHEVAVGPVHAGVIEPGHFRFQCHGETVYHLEISLGFQHRGLEKRLVGGPGVRTLLQMETVSGDATIGHTLAYCRLMEALSATRVSARAQALRGVAQELERLANHIGDLGALAGDAGFLPGASLFGALRGDFLNMSAVLCGSRLGRSLLKPGGCNFDLEIPVLSSLQDRLKKGKRQVRQAADVLLESPSVLARFENTGTVTFREAIEIGMVGPAARACGIARDVRQDFPAGIHQLVQIPVATASSGEVYGRALVRWLEIQRSITFIEEILTALPAGEIFVKPAEIGANRFVVSLAEGWRGEICHMAITDDCGKFVRYKIVDPSFHNWLGLALCLRGTAISDFPLCNKSFNLSYCGHDL